MQTAQEFLLAAKRCEQNALDQLGLSCELVGDLGELVHQLQRERGAANIFLGSGGRLFLQQWHQQRDAVHAAELSLRSAFSRLAAGQRDEASCARLFSRIAWVLQGLDELRELRQRIALLELSAAASTQAFTRLIAVLLSLVFEVADTATDPELTRLLVALFHLLQGKEFAGQERALGASCFATGFFSAEARETLSHLQEAQGRSFDTFTQFAPDQALAHWQELQTSTVYLELQRLRQVARTTSDAQCVPPALSEIWYELTSHRIDTLHHIEQSLGQKLKRLARQKARRASADLLEYRHCLDALAARDQALLADLHRALERALGDETGAYGDWQSSALVGLSPHFSRSLVDLIHSQAQRLQTMQDELSAAKKTLQERKLIERAKGLLMSQRGLSEDQAYQLMRQSAMAQHRRLAEVAEAIVNSVQLLQTSTHRQSKAVPL